MAATLPLEVKRIAKELGCDVLGWGSDTVTMLYKSEEQKPRLLNRMTEIGWHVIPETKDTHDLSEQATTLDFCRNSHATELPGTQTAAEGRAGDMTLNTSSASLTWVILIVGTAIASIGFLSARHEPMPRQLVEQVACLGFLIVLYVSIFAGRSSFQKITLAADHVGLSGPGRKREEVLPLKDIQTWNYRRTYFAKGFAYVIAFKMRNGESHEIKCAAKYAPRIMGELKKRLP